MPAAFEASPELLSRLRQIATQVNRPKGSILFEHGDASSGLLIVLKGKVKLSLGARQGAYPARFIGEGGLLGLPATMSGEPYSLTAEVFEDATLAFISRDDVIDLLKKSPELSFEVMHLLSEEISSMRAELKAGILRPRAKTETSIPK